MGGGGSTSTMGSIAPELRGLYTSSADALVGQQQANPLGRYNEANPMETAGSNPLQEYGAAMLMGGNLPTGLDGLALQSILRSPGLAGAGPTTGEYDYGSEAGLGDLMSFLNPSFGTAPGLDDYARSTPGQGFTNATPQEQSQYDPGYNLSDVLGGPGSYPGGPPPPSPFALPTSNAGGPGSPSWAGYGAQGGPNGQAGVNSPAANPAPQQGLPPPPAAPGAPSQAGHPLRSGAPVALAGRRDFADGAPGSLSELNAILADRGISAAWSDQGLRLSGNGQSYENLGGSHEGAGPGGQSAFLSQVLGIDEGPGSYRGELADLDRYIAHIAQQGRQARSNGLTPGDENMAEAINRVGNEKSAFAKEYGQFQAPGASMDPAARAAAAARGDYSAIWGTGAQRQAFADAAKAAHGGQSLNDAWYASRPDLKQFIDPNAGGGPVQNARPAPTTHNPTGNGTPAPAAAQPPAQPPAQRPPTRTTPPTRGRR